MTDIRPIRFALAQRIDLQAQEADVRGLTKLASELTSLAETVPIRNEELIFSYSQEELQSRLKESFWRSALEVMNYHNVLNFDAQEVNEILSQAQENLIMALQNKLAINSLLGPFDSATCLPGVDQNSIVDLDIEE